MIYSYIETKAGYKIAGKTNDDIVMAGGGTDWKHKYIFGDNGTGTIQAYSPENGSPTNSFKPVKSGFYRPNGENGFGALLMWVTHAQDYNNYGAGIHFDYGGTNAYITGIDGSGNKLSNKKIWHSEDFNQAQVDYWKYLALVGAATISYVDGNFVTKNTPESIEAMKTFNGATGNAYNNSAIMINGNGSSNTVYPSIGFHQPSLYAGVLSYRGPNEGFQFRSLDVNSFENVVARGYIKSGSDDNSVLLGGGGHKPVSDFWHSANFNPDSKVNRSGDTMTGNLYALTISAQNGSDKLIYDNIENYGSPLKINANASLGIYLQANGTDILYVGPSFISSYRDLHMESNTVIYTSTSNSDQWRRAYTHALVDRGAGFVSNVDANNLANETGITSIETGNGSGNTNFPFYGYGNFLKMSSRSFTSEFAHQNDGNLYHRNWYLGSNASGYVFRKIWDDINFNPASYVLQSSLNSQLANYATLNGVQTFTNTITFGQSPVIPSGTLGTHAVNLNQLNNKADKTTAINAGTGLTGGGDLTTNRTIGLDATTQDNIEKGVAAYNYGNHADAGYLKNFNGFLIDSLYREIDSELELDDPTTKEHHIVFDGSSDIKVRIRTMVDGQTFRISNFSPGNIVELWVNGYSVALDTIDAGDTKLYLSHHSGKLRRLSANPTGVII